MEKKDGFFERFFGISKNGSTMKIEILAGVTTFITIAYILILNPQILADPYMIMGDTVMAGKVSNGVFIGTCLGAFIGTIMCAIYGSEDYSILCGWSGNCGQYEENKPVLSVRRRRFCNILVSC